jgi:phosphoribosylglycinamide formyltransferase-1
VRENVFPEKGSVFPAKGNAADVRARVIPGRGDALPRGGDILPRLRDAPRPCLDILPAMTPIGILLSGRGSNFVAIQQAIARGEIPAEIVLVASNVADAAGLAKARELGLSAVAIPHQGAPGGRQAHEEKVIATLRAAGAEWVCLAGYMRLLSPAFVASFRQRIVNIHPSLLPAFPGLDAQEAAFAHGVKVSGCTVHLVDEGLDSGPIVVQRAVPALAGDSAADLAARILEAEHLAYPEALRRLLSEPWRIEGRRLVFAGGSAGVSGDAE